MTFSRPFPRSRAAFSLIEVAVALALVVFGMVSLLGLLTVGVQTSRDSSDVMKAADVASRLISLRRSAPTNALPASFPVPRLDAAASGSAYLSGSGDRVAPAQAAYRLSYAVATNGDRISTLSFRLTWPASADPDSQSQLVKGRYELFTCVPLP